MQQDERNRTLQDEEASARQAETESAPAEATVAVLDEVLARLAQSEEAQTRLAADFANYRRRVERDRAEWEDAARGDLLVRLLPVFDNLRRARQAASQAPGGEEGASAVLTGLDMVIRGMDETLAALGVEESVHVGDAFDPSLGEAIGEEEREDIAPGQVSSVLQAGYRLAGRVLRPALVRVAAMATDARVEPVGREGGV